MNFSEFGLHPDLLDGIDALNYTTATPIQEQAIPLVLEGKDIIGVAQTGTGKTAAFVLPIIHRILDLNESGYTQALVIVPTRELAMQIDQVIEAYSYFTGVSSRAIFGGGDGKEFTQEKKALTSGADIIIATPGRLIAHMNLGYVDFKRLHFLVLDEADRMMDMGFQPDLLTIINTLNKERQTLLFSATMPDSVMRFARSLLRNPVSISIALSKPAEGVTQAAYVVHDRQKIGLIKELLRDKAGQRVIVFCSTKKSVSSLYQQLQGKNLMVGYISSDLEQDQREKTMLDFRNRKIEVLVATDVLSRGIDVDGIDMVINYDVPRDAEDYVHRIGRTARAARKGTAITLISQTDQRSFKKIETLIGKDVPKLELPANIGPGPAYDPNNRSNNAPPKRPGAPGGGGGKSSHHRGGKPKPKHPQKKV